MPTPEELAKLIRERGGPDATLEIEGKKVLVLGRRSGMTTEAGAKILAETARLVELVEGRGLVIPDGATGPPSSRPPPPS